MYTKTDKTVINQYFNFSGNDIVFSDNGGYEFSYSAFIAFKKFNQYIDKTAQYLTSYADKILKIYNDTEQYCFSIIKREFIEAKSEKQIFIDSIVKKYEKHFVNGYGFDSRGLNVWQQNNKLIISNRQTFLLLNDTPFIEDFKYGADCVNIEKYIPTINNIICSNYGENYFHFPKSLSYGKLTIDFENELIFNENEGEKIKIKTSETLKYIGGFGLENKTFKLCTGKKIEIVENENKDTFYCKVENKDFSMFFMVNTKNK